MTTTTDTLLVKKNWQDVLKQVEETVTEALLEVDERGQALEEFIQSARSSASSLPSWPQILEDFLQRKHQLRELAEKAGQKVAEVEKLLVEREEELRQWLDEARVAQEKLMAWKQRSDNPQPPASA